MVVDAQISKLTDKQRKMLAALFGFILLLVLLLLVSLDDFFKIPQLDVVKLRELKVAVPPPPPPAPLKKVTNTTAPDLGAAAKSNPVDLLIVDLEVELPAAQFDGADFSSGAFGDGVSGNLGLDLGAVSLSELDGLPTIVYEPMFAYPKELIERGIGSFSIKVHILIDENGNVTLKGFIENPFPQYNDRFEKYIESFLFTIPRVNKKPTATEFAWPHSIEYQVR